MMKYIILYLKDMYTLKMKDGVTNIGIYVVSTATEVDY